MSLAYDLDHRFWRRPRHRSAASTPLETRPARRTAATTQPQNPIWLESVAEQLLDVLVLSDDWDGPGSRAPSEETVQVVLAVMYEIAKSTTQAPKLAPVPDGSLQLVWYAGGIELEITIEPSGEVDIGLFDVEKDAEEKGVTLQDPRLADAISRLSV